MHKQTYMIIHTCTQPVTVTYRQYHIAYVCGTPSALWIKSYVVIVLFTKQIFTMQASSLARKLARFITYCYTWSR